MAQPGRHLLVTLHPLGAPQKQVEVTRPQPSVPLGLHGGRHLLFEQVLGEVQTHVAVLVSQACWAVHGGCMRGREGAALVRHKTQGQSRAQRLLEPSHGRKQSRRPSSQATYQAHTIHTGTLARAFTCAYNCAAGRSGGVRAVRLLQRKAGM